MECFDDVRVLVVGDVMLDRYWFGEVDRISPEAPVPVLRLARCEEREGGAANVARNVAALGAKATLLGVVGDDDTGRALGSLVREAGYDARLTVAPGLATTVKLRMVARSQQLLRVDSEATPPPTALDELEAAFDAALGGADLVVLSDYGKGALARVTRLLTRARWAGTPVLVDPKGRDFARYAGATLLTPNRGEFTDVAGTWLDEAELADKAQALRGALDLDAVLVTRSEDGMSLFDAEGSHHERAELREVYDVAGAGDTVIATLAVTRAAGASWRDAVRLANRAAGIAVGRFGTAAVSAAELMGPR